MLLFTVGKAIHRKVPIDIGKRRNVADMETVCIGMPVGKNFTTSTSENTTVFIDGLILTEDIAAVFHDLIYILVEVPFDT